MLEELVDLSEAFDLTRRDSFADVHGPKMVRVSQARRAYRLAQRGKRIAVKLAHANVLVVDHERALAPEILRRHAGRATVGMASLRLDATQRKHESAGCIAPIGAERQQARDVETGDHPPAPAQANGWAQSRPHRLNGAPPMSLSRKY